MSANDEKVIALSKAKLVALVIGALTMAAGGLWIAALDQASLLKNAPFGGHVFPFNNPTAMHVVAIVGIAFFGACALFGVFKCFDHKPGLVLNAAGFTDNASGVAAGFVPWTQVKAVLERDVKLSNDYNPSISLKHGFTYRTRRIRFLIVQVHHPERYIDRGNVFKRVLNRINANMVGSPICITSSVLKIDFDELLTVFKSYLSRYGNTPT
ncbi:MAG: STM3941 family protein [Rudaea sp.]